MDLLKGKVAVIAGAGRGVGRAVTEAFAAEGAAVALAARTSTEIEQLASEIKSRGGSALAIPTDISKTNEVDNLIARVLGAWGAIDILVTNAAANGPIGMVWETDPDEWVELYNINVVGMVRCARAVLPSMIERRSGKIIIVGSVAGYSDAWAARRPDLAAYGLTKAATNRLARLLSEQVKPFGINVNCIGVSARTRLDYEARLELARRHGEPPPPHPADTPRREKTLPEENVAPFVFLASSLSDHITGQYIEANTLPDGLRAE
jgi:NAD(P)-dependent dehydrogenase (short-subunit alcohol dehydrogenase family)